LKETIVRDARCVHWVAVFTGGFLAPGGRLFAMASVGEQWPGRAYLRLLTGPGR
jgi:hypothetical protein